MVDIEGPYEFELGWITIDMTLSGTVPRNIWQKNIKALLEEREMNDSMFFKKTRRKKSELNVTA